ncbi:cold-shock protein [Phenylobacterium deserti]|uniref:Cold-shock protein n=1 Tax=Phenylobacterium deserti TaxID=1914756 RepID=A0A328ASN0_9CAUL|nr:cold-shock protein [Phenylobacterium deserti]RAK57617.1 cold-shock protein [Phenylobacterium deserti]
MTRDAGLEELLRGHLGDEPGLSETSMFGGHAWLLHGHLLCAARRDGILARLGKGNDGWALDRANVVTLVAGRPMPGWVKAGPDACADDDFRTALIDAALTYVRALPAKTS